MAESKVVGGKEVADALRKKVPTLREALREQMVWMGFDLQAHIRKDYLTGGALKVATGRLRNSIVPKMTEEGDKVKVVVGTNVEYARRWELGFEGTEDVKEHLRLVTQAFGEKLKTPVWATVKAHKREVKIDARPFLKPALEDKRKDYKDRIKRTIKRVAASS